MIELGRSTTKDYQQIAERMGIKSPSVTRLESSLNSEKNEIEDNNFFLISE